MLRFKDIENLPPDQFLRNVGIPLYQFQEVLEKVTHYIETEKKKNPLKRRGIKSSKDITLSDKLLLTLYYMRHYETFANLGLRFGITESYANKIYHRILTVLTKVLDMPNPKSLLDPTVETVAIDVTEQPVERPLKKQKEYYSGKKKDIP